LLFSIPGVLSAEHTARYGKIKARNYRIGSAARQFLWGTSRTPHALIFAPFHRMKNRMN